MDQQESKGLPQLPSPSGESHFRGDSWSPMSARCVLGLWKKRSIKKTPPSQGQRSRRHLGGESTQEGIEHKKQQSTSGERK